MNPQRIMAYPYTAYIAPQGTVFPLVSENEETFLGKEFAIQEGGRTSGSNLKLTGKTATESAKTKWFKIGTAGSKDYSEAGVTLTHTQTVGSFMGAGSTLVKKAWRSDEALQIAFDLADISPQQYAKIMDEAAITTVTGASGTEAFSLFRGLQIKGQSLLLRGISSVKEGLFSQYEVGYCYQSANPAPKFAIKGGPALLSLQYLAMEPEYDIGLGGTEAENVEQSKFAVLRVATGK